MNQWKIGEQFAEDIFNDKKTREFRKDKHSDSLTLAELRNGFWAELVTPGHYDGEPNTHETCGRFISLEGELYCGAQLKEDITADPADYPGVINFNEVAFSIAHRKMTKCKTFYDGGTCDDLWESRGEKLGKIKVKLIGANGFVGTDINTVGTMWFIVVKDINGFECSITITKEEYNFFNETAYYEPGDMVYVWRIQEYVKYD